LHTYLRVPHVSQVALHGLQGHTYWDAVQHLHQPAQRLQETSAALRFDGETDRVYEAVQTALTLAGPSGQLSIAQSPSMSEVVVWNPAAERCASLGDMPADGWAQMLCVEAACINTPVVLAPGQAWSGWQELAVRGA
jgi:glucose-6-phosphate 1-epimerase